MNINDIIVVNILKLDNFGKGIARYNNFVIFVDNALPDEEVKIKISSVKKSYAEGEIIEIIKPSTNRRIYDCKYYDKCGGCNIGHQCYDSQIKYKEFRIKETLNIDKFQVLPANEINYRNKIVLRVYNNKVGLYERKSNKVVNIDYCLISNNNINNIINKLNNFKYLNEIKEITIRSLDKTMINFTTYNDIKDKITEYFNFIDSIYINNKYVYGLENISIKILDLDFVVSNNSFFQVNNLGTEILYNKVIEYSNLNKEENVLDLYCGVGTISLVLSKYCKKVTGIEIFQDAINNANINKKINNINNADFICGKVEDTLNSNMRYDVLIIDPPRSGIEVSAINVINEINPNKIVYVSCNPDTLIRDIKLLNKYVIKDVSVIDMFPNTYHVETVVLMSRVDK